MHYGVPIDGADAVARRLRRARRAVPLGVNLVKTVASAQQLAPLADYLMLNLSCPNTTDDQDFFDEPARVAALLPDPPSDPDPVRSACEAAGSLSGPPAED